MIADFSKFTGKWRIGVGIFTAIGFFSLGFFLAKSKYADDSNSYSLRDHDSEFKFIKPLLACDVGSQEESGDLSELKRVISDYLNQASDGGRISRAAVYFRDLPTGDWTGVNLEEKFFPASLMKVAVLLAYQKMAEKNPAIKEQRIAITPELISSIEQDIVPSRWAVLGQEYSVKELLDLMIVESDNTALNALLSLTATDQEDIEIRELLEDLKIPFVGNKIDYLIGPREYSRFFRILYNSTYLSDRFSEEALDLLTKTSFSEGLIAGVPSYAVVAHKFGESRTDLPNGKYDLELHDCGNIYLPQGIEYNVCIMTAGDNFGNLAKVISDLSAIIYEYRVNGRTRPTLVF